MRAAIFDDPAKVRMITIRNAAFDDSQILLLKGYTGLWWLDLSHTKIGPVGIRDLDCRWVRRA